MRFRTETRSGGGAVLPTRQLITSTALARLRLSLRDEEPPPKQPKKFGTSSIIAIALASIAVTILVVVAYRRWKKTRSIRYSLSGHDDSDRTADAESSSAATSTTQADPTGRAGAAGNGSGTSMVDRNASVRSVMTLPPYRPKPTDTEHVLGREGERDGIDVVIEMPTAEDDEHLREEEMDTLFQIRLARRRQIAEREARNAARREARARNDQRTVQALRQQHRTAAATNAQELQDLRSEHERVKETRLRAVSSVSYADLGVARLDGTRIRANSTESERVGLLSDAASMSASALSPASVQQGFTQQHQRGRSASSALSVDTVLSDGGNGISLSSSASHPLRPALTNQSSTGSAGQQQQPASADATSNRGSTDQPPEEDVGDAAMPLHSPPGYDEVSLNDGPTPAHSRSTSPYPDPPPVYSAGPNEARNRRLSALVADLAVGASAADASGDVSSTSNEGAAVATPSGSSVSDRSTGDSNSSANGDGNGNDNEDGGNSRRSPRGGGLPQLPSLRLSRLPQIVIEPSSAAPRDGDA